MKSFNCLFYSGLFLFFFQSLSAQTWQLVGNGTEASVNCFAEYNGNLIVAGGGHVGFTSKGIASWDGSQWNPFGNNKNPNNGIYAVSEFNNELIIAGAFGTIDTISNTKFIAAWNGSQWHGLGNINNTDFQINSLEVFNGELYAGGYFVHMGGISCNRIARWNGTIWNNVGGGVTGAMPMVYSMCVYDGELYVGGNFQMAGGISANGMARWNGIQWDSVGMGVYGLPVSMIVDSVHNNLIIGGNFASPDTNIGIGICAWNGTNYLSYGNGLGKSVLSLAIYKDYLFAALPSINGTIYDTTLTYWDSTSWKPVLGPNDTPGSLANFNNELYVGGGFTMVDTINTKGIIRYVNPSLGISEIEFNENKLKIFPNPANGSVTISFVLMNGMRQNVLRIYNPGGKMIVSKKINAAQGEYRIGEGQLPKGIYIVTVQNKKEKLTGKFVIE